MLIDRIKEYKDTVEYDRLLLKSTRDLNDRASFKEMKKIEMRYVKAWRLASVFKDNIIVGRLARVILRHYSKKTNVSIPPSVQIGKGFIIGHPGTIIINSKAQIGNDFVITQGAVIGMDMRGRRKGCPVIGDRVCINANAVLVGNIHIGNDVLIAPNAFVNFDVPDHSIVIGNPGIIHHRDNATEGHIGIV